MIFYLGRLRIANFGFEFDRFFQWNGWFALRLGGWTFIVIDSPLRAIHGANRQAT